MPAVVLTLRLVVAVLATLLAIGIGAHAWRQRSVGIACLAFWMAALSTSAWLAVVMIMPNGRLLPMGRLLTGLLTTIAGPLLVAYVTYAVRGVRLHWAWGVPFVAYVAAGLVLGTRLNAHVSGMFMILIECVYTAVAWLVWFRNAKPRSSQPAVIGVLAAVTAAHVGQGLGILDLLGYLDFHPIRQAALVIIGGWLAVATVMALADSPLIRRLAPPLTPPVSDAERTLFLRMEQLMQDAGPWRDPDFDVGAMARLLGTHSNAVSKALSRAGSTTFYDYVNEYRVREVQRLLADPTESRIKVDALGRQAGFRARSTLFKLFRQHTGLTPAEYRASHATGPNGSSSPSVP